MGILILTIQIGEIGKSLKNDHNTGVREWMYLAYWHETLSLNLLVVIGARSASLINVASGLRGAWGCSFSSVFLVAC